MKMEKIWTREVGNNPNLIDLFNFHSPKLASLKKDFLSISIHFPFISFSWRCSVPSCKDYEESIKGGKDHQQNSLM